MLRDSDDRLLPGCQSPLHRPEPGLSGPSSSQLRSSAERLSSDLPQGRRSARQVKEWLRKLISNILSLLQTKVSSQCG